MVLFHDVGNRALADAILCSTILVVQDRRMAGVKLQEDAATICNRLRRILVAQNLFQTADFIIRKNDRIFLVACHDGNLLAKCMIVSIIVP